MSLVHQKHTQIIWVEEIKENFPRVKSVSITQYRLLVCDFKMRKKKANKRNFVLGRKVRKLHDDSIRSYNCSYHKKFKWGSGDDVLTVIGKF